MSDEDEQTVMSDIEADENSSSIGDKEEKKVCPLTQETTSEGLSLLCRTGNGLGHAFVKLDLKDKGLTDIAAVSSYIHLRFLDISGNHLSDLSPLASLIHLLWLKVDNNAVAHFKGQPFAQLPYLQWLSMAANQLMDLDGFAGAALESLTLTGNRIKTVNGLQCGSFANLMTLELRGNSLDNTDGINLPNLRKLYLAQNSIKCLKGLAMLEHLSTLHLRDNQLETLQGLSSNMKCLQYLNVRGNAITEENALQYLRLVSKTLRTVVLSNNPLVETTDYRVSVLIHVPQLERIDKDHVSPEERTEAQDRLKEEEITEP
ncbi:leucine-rich repeat-containing protein 23 [Solea senegalensis]|uniref:Leucine-rich repeat-containing protein 23 n=1 Tax=Solea senegalensis TaxID=28829 RepID=A0AAV6SVA3_SOLSE|nr:leucine-rich repeat-containing protein 23 [Solea senegalensis]KAG7521304.1 leucine-rich repeat-containing protein 23 [Solea senegalensis]